MDQDDDQSAPILDQSSRQFALATSKFFTQVADTYSDIPFLSAECVSKSMALDSRVSKSNILHPSTPKKRPKHHRLCPKCKIRLVVGRTSSVRWQSKSQVSRRFGGEKGLRKIRQRIEQGLSISKWARKSYDRYSNNASKFRVPRLVITCGTCGYSIPNPLAPPIEQKTPAITDQSSNAQSADSKKRRRRKKTMNAGLNFSGSTSKSMKIQSDPISTTPKFTTSTPTTTSVTPKRDPGTFSGGNQSKKKIKSRLQRLLAAESDEKKKDTSFGTPGALSSFLESL